MAVDSSLIKVLSSNAKLFLLNFKIKVWSVTPIQQTITTSNYHFQMIAIGPRGTDPLHVYSLCSTHSELTPLFSTGAGWRDTLMAAVRQLPVF